MDNSRPSVDSVERVDYRRRLLYSNCLLVQSREARDAKCTDLDSVIFLNLDLRGLTGACGAGCLREPCRYFVALYTGGGPAW